jgi:hypothetical protein
MQMIKGKTWMGLLAAAVLVAPVAVMGSQITTRPPGAAATQPTTRPVTATQPTTQPTGKADAEAIKEQLPDYPLDTCVVSGEKLGGMGEPYNHVYKDRLVRFCCKHCLPEFKKNPDKYLAMIDKAAATRPAKKTDDKVTR